MKVSIAMPKEIESRFYARPNTVYECYVVDSSCEISRINGDFPYKVPTSEHLYPAVMIVTKLRINNETYTNVDYYLKDQQKWIENYIHVLN